MQPNAVKWLAGLAFAVSLLTLGNTMYSTDTGKIDQRMTRIEMEHKDDVSQLRKKHDGDIDAVRVQMDHMETGIHSKLDNILRSITSLHVDVKVNSSKIENIEGNK
jgi:hypothetical protein